MSRVHLVNPSSQSFGVGVITPRWLDVLAAATGCRCGDGDVIWPRVVADGFAAELRPIYDGGRLVTARSVSQLYRQMYANTGIATDSARMQRSARWA